MSDMGRIAISLSKFKPYYNSQHGFMIHGDALNVMREMADESVDLIMTSPPFGLVRKKTYGNVDSDEYVAWFRDFGVQFRRILKPTGSLVIDIGGAWIPGQPTRSLYHFELLIMLCKDPKIRLHLAQEFFWWNPSKLPTPAEWVNVRRVRVKDAVNCVWWLSKTPWPKASNKRVLAPYSRSMNTLLKNGYKAKLRPSGHDISDKFAIDNGAAIPPNLIAIPNTESNSYYLRYCQEKGYKPHPARFPAALPEFFIRMLTNRDDFVFDPFGGSCVTGEVCERLRRKWVCCDLEEEYLKAAVGRFDRASLRDLKSAKASSYSLYHPAALWNGDDATELPKDGGKERPKISTKPTTPKGREGCRRFVQQRLLKP